MNIVVFGTRSFGTATANLINNRPDTKLQAVIAPHGDKLHTSHPDIAIDANTYHPDQLPPTDLIIAAHSHTYIGQHTRRKATIGALGYHPSLLPRHKGRDAIKWTLRMQDAITGGSWFWLTNNIDAGPLAWQQHIHTHPLDDHHTLWRRLFNLGLEGLTTVLNDITAGTIRVTPQDEHATTWEPSLDTQPLHRTELHELGPTPPGYTYTTDPAGHSSTPLPDVSGGSHGI